MRAGWRLRLLAIALATLPVLANAVPAAATRALPPGQKKGPYARWEYPPQLSYGPIETGSGLTGSGEGPGAFLTLPFRGPHYVTSVFDHCSPNYGSDDRVCRYDGVIASKSRGGPDPTFDAGFAQTPGAHDYLYYDGHDGYDYGLNFEPVAAAAGGVVKMAAWFDPNCHSCVSGLTVIIDHGNGLETYYGHLSELRVAKGDYVRRGQVIAISGSSGTATGPHLHFGVYYVDGRGPVDPYGWSGSGPDPWAKDLGDLWLSGSPRFADIPIPHVSVTAVRDIDQPTVIHVSWSSPGAVEFQVDSVDALLGTMTPMRSTVSGGAMDFTGRAGRSYFFWVSVSGSLGWGDAAASDLITIPRPSMQGPA